MREDAVTAHRTTTPSKRTWLEILVLALVVGLAATGLMTLLLRHQAGTNYSDHIRSCEAQNEMRRQENRQWAENKNAWLEAARARARSAQLEKAKDPAQALIDQRAAILYQQTADAVKPIPIIDCHAVVKHP